MVSSWRTIHVGTLLLVGALAIGCKKGSSPVDPANTLARIGDTVISVGDFEKRVNQSPPAARARLATPEAKKELLDKLVRFEVLAREAEKRGLDKDVEFVDMMKQNLIQRLMARELDKIRPEDVPKEDCEKYFNEHRNEYNQPEQVRASVIVVKDV